MPKSNTSLLSIASIKSEKITHFSSKMKWIVTKKGNTEEDGKMLTGWNGDRDTNKYPILGQV